MIRKFVAEIEKVIDSSSIVLSSNIEKYFSPGEETVYLKGRLIIVDSSILEIALFVTEFRKTLSIDKYRLHYMNSAGQVLFRYDNAPHHPDIDTHPHHKHTSAKISASNVPSMQDLEDELEDFLLVSDRDFLAKMRRSKKAHIDSETKPFEALKKDLDDLAGTWSEKDEREFKESTSAFSRIDEDLWS